MNEHEIFGLIQVVVVIALVVIAAALATPKGRLPLALRGLAKIMRKDRAAAAIGGGVATDDPAVGERNGGAVSLWKRLLAFVLVLMAAALALIVV